MRCRRLIAAALVASFLASASPAAAAEGGRIAGEDRYETAYILARATRALEGCGTGLVVASGGSFPDGLAGAVFGFPVLLANPEARWTSYRVRIPDNSLRLCLPPVGSDPPHFNALYVLGGPGAVSADVVSGLRRGYEPDLVKRIAGTDRYETAIAIARTYGVGDTVILATGDDFPDALAAGPLAAKRGIPIILNTGTSLRPEVAEFFDDHPGITNAYIVGGTAAVPASVANELRSTYGIAVDRLAGSDRAGTAAAIADEAFPNTGCALLVNGDQFADALAAGPYGAARYCPILLVNKDTIPVPTRQWLTSNAPTLERVIAIGGTAVISHAVVADAIAAAD